MDTIFLYGAFVVLATINVPLLLRVYLARNSREEMGRVKWDAITMNLFVVLPSLLIVYAFAYLFAVSEAVGALVTTVLSLLTVTALSVLFLKIGWFSYAHVPELGRIRQGLARHDLWIQQMSGDIEEMRQTGSSSSLDNVERNVRRLETKFSESSAQIDELTQMVKWLREAHESQNTNEPLDRDALDRIRDDVAAIRSDVTHAQRVVYGHEIRLAANEDAIAQVGKRAPLPVQPAVDIFEGKVFGAQVRDLLQKAWHSINNPQFFRPPDGWLTNDQLSLRPSELDFLIGIYLLERSPLRYAYLSNLEVTIKWMRRGEIKDLATASMVKGFVSGRELTKDEWRAPGSPPFVYTLTERALKLFFGSSSSAGSLHSAMELAIFHEAIAHGPPKLFASVVQVPGEARCDDFLIERLDSRAFDWPEMIAVNCETPEEIRAHSSTEVGKEGQVFLNMITSFVFGVKHLWVVCLMENQEKLTQMRDTLPSWISSRIRIKVVNV